MADADEELHLRRLLLLLLLLLLLFDNLAVWIILAPCFRWESMIGVVAEVVDDDPVSNARQRRRGG